MPAFVPTAPLPADIRLMNATASLIGGIGIAVLCAVALLWAARQPAFALRAISVDGDLTHNSALTIRANAAPKLSGNFFTLDLAAGRRAFEAVPWVRQAIVRRVWPNRLAVRLEEHRPVALWEGAPALTLRGDGVGPLPVAAEREPAVADRLVNDHGEVFEAGTGEIEDDALPTLRGPDGSSAQVLRMYGRLQREFDAMRAHVDVLELSGRGSWRVELDTGADVEIGRGTDDEVVARAREFVATLPELRARYQQHPLLYADLRHRDGYAVRLKGVTTTPDAPVAPARKKREGPTR